MIVYVNWREGKIVVSRSSSSRCARRHPTARADVMSPAGNSNLPLQVLIFLNGWYDVVYVVVMQALYIWKGAELPYPGSLSSIMALEVCLVFVLGVLEYCRLFLASRGNKTERYLPLVFSIVLALPCGYLFFYYLAQQLYVSRLDVIINSIGLAFVGLELLLSLVTVFTLLKAPPPSQG